MLADVAEGTIVRVIDTESHENNRQFPEDGWQNGVLLFYAGNGRIDNSRDPWFNLGPRDNLVLLAPGLTDGMGDDIPISIWGENSTVTRSSFSLPPTN